MNEHDKVKIRWDEVELVGEPAQAPEEPTHPEHGVPSPPPLTKAEVSPWLLAGVALGTIFY